MNCPYCNSKDVIEWESKFAYMYNTVFYRCYTCGKRFEERDIKGCGKQIFRYGDNYPVFNKGGDKMKFKRGNPVRIKIDTGIYYEGEILTTGLADNMYKVKYFDGYKYIVDFFEGKELELIEDKQENIIPICPKCNNNNKVETSISIIYEWYCRKCNFWFNNKSKNDNGFSTKLTPNNPNHKLKKDRIKFEKMGIMPKVKKGDLIDLWIDLWVFLKDKINGKKEIRK